MVKREQTNWTVAFVRVFVLFLAAGIYAYGQTTTATLSGVVRDASGAVVPDAKVTLTSTVKSASRTTTTDGQGRYNLTNLDPGAYELRVEHTGFSTAEQSGVVLTVGGATNVDVVLRVGSVTEVVEVQSEEPLIDASRPELSRVVNEQSIDSLPNLGRNFVDFAALSSGVARGRENEGGGAFKEPDTGVGQAAAPRLTFGGQPELNTMVLVDGAENIQTFTGLPRATPSQEAVQEFRILNSTYLAEYGRADAGYVNIVTKSGTNAYDGSFYYFGMNQALNEPYLLNPPNPRLQQNQFGATLGGPVKKDRTFFFVNYEGQRRAQTNQYSTVVLNNITAINVAKAFWGLSPENLALLRTNDYDGFFAKLDHNLTASNRVSIRYDFLDSIADGFLGGNGRGSPGPTTARNNSLFDQSLVGTETAVIGARTVNEASFQWARRTYNFPSALKEPDLEVPDLVLTGKSTSDLDFYRESRAQASDYLSLVRGGHAFKVGAEFNYLNDNYQWNLFFPARVIFANFACFLGQANCLGPNTNPPGVPFPVLFWWPFLQGATSNPGYVVQPGTPQPFTEDVPAAWRPYTFAGVSHDAYGFFAQDEWKATPKLTLSYGLRYDFEAYPAALVPREPYDGVQPRIGFAYAFSPRTVVRGGFGIFDGRLVSSVGQSFGPPEWLSTGYLPHASILYPGIVPIKGRFPQAVQVIPAVSPTTPLEDLLTLTSTGQVPAIDSPGTIFPFFSDNVTGHLKIPYTEQASLKISHELARGVAVSLSYLYVHGVDQGAITGNLNAVQTGTIDGGKACYGVAVVNDVCQGPTNSLFPELASTFFVEDSGGSSVYNGGTVEIEKRFSRGLSFEGSYTFSKTISNYESVANLADFPQQQDRNLERAVSRQSVPQRFTLALVSVVPGNVRFLHDLNFSTLIAAQSGQFYNIFAGSDVNQDGNPLSDRPGTLGRDTLKGPNIFSWNVRVARPVHFSERWVGEFTFDLFNVTNRINVSDLNTVCECDLPAADFSGAMLSSTIKSLNPLFGFDTARATLNPFQFQYGFTLNF